MGKNNGGLFSFGNCKWIYENWDYVKASCNCELFFHSSAPGSHQKEFTCLIFSFLWFCKNFLPCPQVTKQVMFLILQLFLSNFAILCQSLTSLGLTVTSIFEKINITVDSSWLFVTSSKFRDKTRLVLLPYWSR